MRKNEFINYFCQYLCNFVEYCYNMLYKVLNEIEVIINIKKVGFKI